MTHSMGGLLARSFLLHHEEATRAFFAHRQRHDARIESAQASIAAEIPCERLFQG
jgi:hypothetical protein